MGVLRCLVFAKCMLLTPCMFLQSTYFQANALSDKIYTTHIKTPASFGIQLPSLWGYEEGVRDNLLIYVLFIVMIFIKN